jgi:hypothetical protein
MRKLAIVMAVAMVLIAVGCHATPNSEREQAEQTEQIVGNLRAQTGMPAIVNAQELKLAKMIYELRDSEDLMCYAYIVNLHGELIFIGQCLGYGLPYSVQFSNPERIAWSSGQGGATTLPQPEPNGLFMPEGLSATWIMLIDPDTGEPRPVYFEPTIVVSPFPLH